MFALLLANLPSIISGVTSLVDFISKARAAAQQTGEWTTDHEAQYQAMLQTMAQAPEQQMDPKSAV